MENAVEALKIAFAVLLFVMALTLSISSFSQARMAVEAITTLRDRDAQYAYLSDAEQQFTDYQQSIYVQPSSELSRIVGIEAVVASMYRATQETVEIYFLDNSGEPLPIYKKLNAQGGEEEMCVVDATQVVISADINPNKFNDVLLGGKTVDNWEDICKKCNIELEDTYKDNGLYDAFANATFEERLGEYEISEGASKVTKRIITYILQ